MTFEGRSQLLYMSPGSVMYKATMTIISSSVMSTRAWYVEMSGGHVNEARQVLRPGRLVPAGVALIV